MKILFCDIDGVLCPHGSCRSVSMNAEEITRSVIEATGNDAYAYLDPRDVAAVALDWDPRSAAILRGVLERTGAALVVESDWRDGLDIDELELLFALHGIEIAGCVGSGEKTDAITTYLEKHSDVAEWCVVDDTDLGFEEHQVKPVGDGFGWIDALKAIRILGGG